MSIRHLCRRGKARSWLVMWSCSDGWTLMSTRGTRIALWMISREMARALIRHWLHWDRLIWHQQKRWKVLIMWPWSKTRLKLSRTAGKKRAIRRWSMRCLIYMLVRLTYRHLFEKRAVSQQERATHRLLSVTRMALRSLLQGKTSQN